MRQGPGCLGESRGARRGRSRLRAPEAGPSGAFYFVHPISRVFVHPIDPPPPLLALFLRRRCPSGKQTSPSRANWAPGPPPKADCGAGTGHVFRGGGMIGSLIWPRFFFALLYIRPPSLSSFLPRTPPHVPTPFSGPSPHWAPSCTRKRRRPPGTRSARRFVLTATTSPPADTRPAPEAIPTRPDGMQGLFPSCVCAHEPCVHDRVPVAKRVQYCCQCSVCTTIFY